MASIIDLNRVERDVEIIADVGVVGAGAAGLFVATELARCGLRVVVLEAGGPASVSGESLGMTPIFRADVYRGALEGRAFGVGGSTARWGGLLIPHSEFDLIAETNEENAVWRHVVREVSRHSAAVLEKLGQPKIASFATERPPGFGARSEKIEQAGVRMMAAEFLPFHRRNFRFLLSAKVSQQVTVIVNAIASLWSIPSADGANGLVRAVTARSQGSHTAHVTAKCFVVAAGAIESARILLEIDRQAKGRLLPKSVEVGRNLSDHLSCSIAEVHAADRRAAAALFGPWFTKGRLRSLRFLQTPTVAGVPRHFAHFIFEIDNPGFRLAKKVFSGLQRRSVPDVTVAELVTGLRGFTDLGIQKMLYSRLHIPLGTRSKLQLDVEQAACAENRVELGSDCDRYGRPRAEIHWHVGETDEENIRALKGSFLRRFEAFGPRFPRLTSMGDLQSETKPHDAYHPVGTCKMGDDTAATVGLNLRVKGTANLYVLSTAVFPTAGTANPTFSMLCLGQSLAERLAASCAADRRN